MDKEKSVNYLEKSVAHGIDFILRTVKDGNLWKATGTIVLSASVDGEHFGSIETTISCYEDDPNASLATLLLNLTNQVNDSEFTKRLETNVKNATDRG